MSARRARFAAVAGDAADAGAPPERTETPRVWSSSLQMFRMRLPSPAIESLSTPVIDLRLPGVGGDGPGQRQPFSPHKLSPCSEFTRLANERARPLLEAIAAPVLPPPPARERASAAEDAETLQKRMAGGLMQRRSTIAVRGAPGSLDRRGTLNRATLLLAVNRTGGASGLVGTSDEHEREAQQAFSQLASSYVKRLAEVEAGGSGLWDGSGGGVGGGGSSSAREANGNSPAHQNHQRHHASGSRTERETKETRAARREAEAERTRQRVKEFRASKQTPEAIVAARLAELRVSPREKAELEQRCDAILSERMIAAKERGDVVDEYNEHVWELATPRRVEEARLARAERARAGAALVAERREAELERRRLETLQQLSRADMMTARRIEAERRLALAQRQASWLALLALASRASLLGATLEDDRPKRDMLRAVRLMQAHLRRYQTRVKVRTMKRGQAKIKPFCWHIALKGRIKRKAAAQEVIRRYLLAISQSGVAFAAVRSYMYRVRQIQRTFRAHRAVVCAQVEVLSRQVRKLEGARAEERGDAGGDGDGHGGGGGGGGGGGIDAGGGGGRAGRGVAESCLRETCFHLLALRRRRHVRLCAFYERACDAFNHVSRVAEVLAEAFELADEEAAAKAAAAKAEAQANRSPEVSFKKSRGAGSNEPSFKKTRFAEGAGGAGGAGAPERKRSAVLTRKSSAYLDGGFLRKKNDERRRSISGELVAANDIHAIVLNRINAFGPSRLLWFIVTIQRRWRQVRKTRRQSLGLKEGRRTAVGPKTLDAFYEALIIQARLQRLLQQQQKELQLQQQKPAFDRSLSAGTADIGTHRSLIAAADIAGRVRNAMRLRRAAAEHGWGRPREAAHERPDAADGGTNGDGSTDTASPAAASKEPPRRQSVFTSTRRQPAGKSVFKSADAARETLHASALLLMDIRRPPQPPARMTALLPSDEVVDVLDASHVLQEENQRAGLLDVNVSHPLPVAARLTPPVEPPTQVPNLEGAAVGEGGWEEAERAKASTKSNPTSPAPLRRAPTRKIDAVLLQGFDVDEASDKSVAEQLRDALTKAAVRVIDLFREWDDDGSGRISRAEFHKACGEMRFHAPAEDIDTLFDTWDPNASGYLELSELRKLLRAGGTTE